MTTEVVERCTLTIEQAAKVLGCGRSLAYEMARDGRLPTLKLGRKLVVPRVALDRMLAQAGQPQADIE